MRTGGGPQGRVYLRTSQSCVVAAPGHDEEDALARERLRWSSVRDPEVLGPTWSERTWSRYARAGWGDALGRPYERVEVPGTAGVVLYLIVGAVAVLTMLIVASLLGWFR